MYWQGYLWIFQKNTTESREKKNAAFLKTTAPSPPKGLTLVAPKQVHWGSKVTSLRRLASELCLGLEVRQEDGGFRYCK